MRIDLVPCESYWDLTHDIVVGGQLNDPEDHKTWDWEGGDNDHPDPTVTLNGSEPLRPEELGKVIKKMVALARTRGCGDYEVIDLSPGR